MIEYRCSCHHWAGWGDSGGMAMRAMCSGYAEVIRESDGRPTCSYCYHHDPEDSAGFSFSESAVERIQSRVVAS